MEKRLESVYIKISDCEVIQVKQNKIKAKIANIAEKYHKLLKKFKIVE